MTKKTSTSAGSVRLDTTKLAELRLEMAKFKDLRVDVGVFDSRNATIGHEHEYGRPSRNLPQRSFLRMPCFGALPEAIKATTNWRRTFIDKGAKGMLVTLGRLGEKAIRLAFDSGSVAMGGFNTGGFELWRPLAPSTVQRKGHDTILIETGQLRQSISSRVV